MTKRPAKSFSLRLGLALVLGAVACAAGAQSDASSVTTEITAYPQAAPEAAPAPAEPPRIRSYSLRQLGAWRPLQLRGVDGTGSLPLDLPQDVDIVSATLKLRYTHSPELLDELSHLNVRLDGTHVAAIPLKRDEAGRTIEREVELPVSALRDFTQLNLQLIGHYTLRCENPLHPSLWADIDNQSELTLAVVPRPAANDLTSLPRPFFDSRSNLALELPFVFAGQPDTAALEAAGVLSSWFGALADYRGAHFPVLHGSLPASGNAVVLIGAADSLGGLALAPAGGPEVAIVDHPAGQGGKLLLVRGRNAEELKQAAQAVALGGQALSGSEAVITRLDVPLRKPYDAPRWLSIDKPVSFGSLTRPASMEVRGFSADAVRVGFRLPPDLYAWKDATVPVDLKYRYTPRPKSDQSWMQVRLNGAELATLPIPAATHATGVIDTLRATLSPDDDTLPAQTTLALPVAALAPDSQLEFQFYYDYVSRGECKDVLIDSVLGRIDPRSTIDISGLPRFIALPDMAAFGNGGYPFTRLADLSETAVVLPTQASPEEHAAYLDLLGRMGASTGYPATRVQVANTGQLDTLRHKDVLVIAGSDVRQTLGAWAKQLRVDADVLQPGLHEPEPLWNRLWNAFFGGKAVAQTAPPVAGTGPAALLTGFESPVSGGRSVVVLATTQPALLPQAVTALGNTETLRLISGSSVSVHADGVRVLENDTRYYAGSLGPLRHTLWYLQRHPLLFALLSALTVAVLGLLMYLTLRSRAQKRLQG